MTSCPKGPHEFLIEDDSGAYCPEHGVTLLWRDEPIAGTPTDSRPNRGGPATAVHHSNQEGTQQ